MQPPDDSGGEGCRAHEVFHVSVEAGRDPPPVLDAAEHALGDIALPVNDPVAVILDFTVFARRDDGPRAAFVEPFAQGPAVIALVGDEFGGGRQGFDAELRDLAVMRVSRRQEQDAGAAFRVADGVELGVAAAFRAADAMSQAPPFPPPAQRWTLMQELSMNSRSGASAPPAGALKMRSHMTRPDQRTKRLWSVFSGGHLDHGRVVTRHLHHKARGGIRLRRAWPKAWAAAGRRAHRVAGGRGRFESPAGRREDSGP